MDMLGTQVNAHAGVHTWAGALTNYVIKQVCFPDGRARRPRHARMLEVYMEVVVPAPAP